MTGSVGLAFLLTTLAGLSTGIGSAIAFFARRTNKKFLSVALGFSAGVMIYVSFVEMFPHAKEALVRVFGEGRGVWITVIAFFGGMVVAGLIDLMVPDYENPHEARSVEDMERGHHHHEVPEDLEAVRDDVESGGGIGSDEARKLRRLGIMAAVAIGVHNFPEGLATFAAALTSVKVGVSIAIAVAIHNIPEGIAVSVPIYYATGSRKQAFWYSFLSGVSEPAGALVGYLILRPFLSDTLFGVIFAAVAGIMVFISLDELIPTAQEYGEGHAAIYGVISGMAVMALSLLIGT